MDADFKRGLVYEELVARVTGPVVHELQAVLLADRYFETETEATAEEECFPAPERAPATWRRRRCRADRAIRWRTT